LVPFQHGIDVNPLGSNLLVLGAIMYILVLGMSFMNIWKYPWVFLEYLLLKGIIIIRVNLGLQKKNQYGGLFLKEICYNMVNELEFKNQ
jgi:hypothetical protein